MFQSQSLENLVAELKKLPGIGLKSATRIAFHFLRTPKEEVETLSRALEAVKEKVRLCSVCGNYTEDETCAICLDVRRDEGLICVVEQPSDISLLEATAAFRGRYHVLHGALSPVEGIRPESLRIAELVERSRDGAIKEVVLATNPTVEGDATAYYIAEALRDFPIEVSRIARGIPVGGELEFADQLTLARALKGRRELT